MNKFSLSKVAVHNTPEDCWLVIWGKVYDVTSWVPTHPGGSFIHVKAGQDSTQLFDSYHPLYVRNSKMLAKYCIGEVGSSPGDESLKSSVVEYPDASNENFYLTLKQGVEAYFKRQKVCR